MIEITIEQLFNCIRPMEVVIKLEMPAPVAYRLARLAGMINTEIEPARNTVTELSKKYGDLKSDEERESYEKELNELLSTTVKLNADKIDIDLLKNVPITPELLWPISWAFED